MKTETYYAYMAGYARALVDHACRQSETLSWSFVTSNLFKTLKELEEYTRRKLPRKALVTSEESLEKRLEGWIGKSDIVEMMERQFGKCEKVIDIEDEDFIDSAGYSRGWSLFYFPEDMFLAKFKYFYILFIMGNNE